MSLFLDSILRKYYTDSPPPNLLKIFNIDPTELDTPQGLLKYSEAFLLLSAHLFPSNSISPSIISENFAIFKDIQERFNLFYQKTSSDPSIIEQLLKVEQSIHLISNEPTLQDASTYFPILCKSCTDGEKLCQLILLLSKKHTLWSGEQSITQHHWMSFMLPFFRFLKKFHFDDFSEQLSQQSLESYMRETIQTLDVKEETIEQQLQEEIQNHKKKKSFYYKLGSLSLLYYMKRFLSDQDLTLFKISIIARCYLDGIKSSGYDTQGKTLLARYELDKILIRDNSIINMVSYIASALMKTENSKTIELFSLLDYAFLKMHNEAQSKQSIFFQKPQSLVTSLFDVLQNHKQQLQSLPSPKYSLFSNYYNFFMWAFLRLVRILKYNLSTQDADSLGLISFYQEKILPAFSKEPLDIFIKGQFYQGFKESFCSSLTTTFTNLKDTFLIFNIDFNNNLNHDGDLYQHFLKFRMASSFITSNSNKKELIDFSSSQEIQDLQNNFLSLIENPSQKDNKSKYYVGIFLLNILKLNLPETFMSFTKSFFNFLVQTQHNLTAWDLSFLRETLWPGFEKTELSFEDCFYECLNLIKESISEFRYPSLNLNDELLKKIKENAEAKEKFYKIVIESSFIEIQESPAKIWSLEPTNSFDGPETVGVLQKQINIFVCYLLPWVSKFAKILIPETLPDDKEKLQIISDKLIFLLSHPMFRDSEEDMNLLNEYRNVYRTTPFTHYLNPLTVIQSLQAQIDEANQALVSGLLQKKDLAQLKVCTFQEEQRGYGSNLVPKIIIEDYNQDQNAYTILIQSLSLNFLRFNKILSYSQAFKGIPSDQQILLTNLESFLKSLHELLFSLMNLFDDEPDIENNNTENFLTTCFEFLSNWMKSFSSTSEDLTKLFVNFYRDLLQKSKENNWNFSCRFYGMIFKGIFILNFNEAPTKKVLTLVFFEYQAWADHIEAIKNFPNSKNLAQNINLVFLFYKKLQRDIFSNYVLQNYPKEFIKTTLFGLISYMKQKLINLSVWEIIPENRNMIHTLLKEIFILFINSCSYLNQLHVTAMKEIKRKVDQLQEQLQKTPQEIETQQTALQNLQTNLDLSTEEKGEKINQSLQTIETLKGKISQAQQDLKTCEQNLKVLVDENRPIIETFQTVADRFACVFPFNSVLSTDSDFINSSILGQKSIKKFLDLFHNEIQNIPNNPVIKNILSLYNYTDILTNLLLCFPHQLSFFEDQESFFPLLLTSSQSLFQTLFDSYQQILTNKDELIETHNFFSKLANLLGETAGIALSYYTAKFFNQPQATFPDISKPVLEWIENILKMFTIYQNSFSYALFDTETLNRNLFATLIGLMQLLQVSDPETAFEEFIKKENSAIRTVLSSKITSPWQQTFSVLLISFFDDYFRASLAPELEIPQRIKEYLITHTEKKLKLADLCENISLIREKEVLCMELLISSLQNYFHFEKHQNHLCITIDPLKETKNPVSQIQSIFQSLSSNSIQVLKLLLDLFIENYLYNLHQLKQTQKISPKTMFKDITSLINILAPLLSKYPQFILYLVFQKEDYADFKELTFIECLFKLQFFTFYPDDSLSLVKALLSYTGVLFNQDATTVLDSNVLVANHLLNLLNQELHSAGEHPYLTFCGVMRIFGFIWRIVGETQSQAAHEILDRKILFILQQLLVHLGHHSKIHSLLSLNYQVFDYVLTENLKEWFKKQLTKRKINEIDLTKIREQNYKNLLENDFFNSDFDTTHIDHLTNQLFQKPTINTRHNLTEDASTDYRKRNYMMNTVDSSFHVDFEFNFPIEKGTNISNDETLENVKTKQVKRYQILSQNTQDKKLMKNLEIHLKQSKFDINDRRFQKKFPNYFPPRTVKCPHLFSVPKEQTFKFETPAQRFYSIIEERLPSAVQQKDPPPPVLQKECRVIKYFSSNPLIQRPEDFEHAKQVILQKLKILTEQLLLEMLYLEAEKEEIIVEIVSKTITQELTQLNEFDGNLLLCLADQFESFKLLIVPDFPLQEMKEEFRWITNNLPEYILTLKTLFGENHDQTVDITKPVVAYDGFIFPTDFAFCIDKPEIWNKENTTKIVSQERASPRPCPMIDKIVESMIILLSGHYIQSGWNSNHHHPLEFLIQLCHSSPVIEIKLIDYCLSTLYCPPQNSDFLVSNVLGFLDFYFSRVNHLIYLPRVLFEKYRLDTRQSYTEKTPNKLSICDLLIGLLEEKAFLSQVKKILTHIFSKPVNLEIIIIEKGQELEERFQVLGQQSIKVLSKMVDEIDNLLINVPDIIFYEYQSITEKMINIVQEVLPILENTNQILNTRLIVNKEKFVPTDIKEVFLRKRAQNKTIGNILCGFSCVLSTWNKSNNPQNIQKQREQNLESLLSHLHSNLFSNKQVKDIIVHFFELLKYLTYQERFFKSESIKIRMMEVFKIGLYYFALQNLIPKSSPDQLDFDLLLKDTPNNYRDILFESFAISSSKELEIQDLVICQNLPQLADLDFKKKFLQSKIKQDRENTYYESLKSISIDRKNLLKSTINEICFSTLKELRKSVKVIFINEYGADAGGLRREFYTIICQELFDPLKGLFMLDENGIGLQPSPSSRIIPDHLIYFELAGIMLAKAISQEMVVDVTLSNGLLKQILNQTIGLNELKEIDSSLAKNLEWMLSNPMDEEIEQSFVYENTLLGRKITQELVPNGYETLITPDTKQDFVRKLTEFKMKKEIKQELEAFLKGFHLIIPSSWLILSSPSELQSLISGDAILNVEEMKLHAQYSGYTQDSQLIKWLWEILQDFSQKELATFLFFVSGSKRIGKNGLASTPIRYRKAIGSNIQRLPTAATCSWAIDIPEYESKEDLKQKLLLAIFDGQQSFQLG